MQPLLHGKTTPDNHPQGHIRWAARRRPAAAGPVRGWERAPRAWECVAMFHVEHTRNGLTFSTLQPNATATATANVPKLPQQYFAGVGATRLHL